MPNDLTVPLVGAHFLPPAKWILAALPSGARLRLEPEPENPYDPKAIRAFGRAGDVPDSQHAELVEILSGAGFDLVEVLALPEIWLGFLADSDGKLGAQGGNREVAGLADGARLSVGELAAELGFDPSGKAMVRVRLP